MEKSFNVVNLNSYRRTDNGSSSDNVQVLFTDGSTFTTIDSPTPASKERTKMRGCLPTDRTDNSLPN